MNTRFSRLARGCPASVGLLLSLLAAAAVADDRALLAPPPPIDLSGEWQLLPGHAAEGAAVASQPDSSFMTGWEKTRVPGVWADGRLDCAWELKRFQVPPEAKGGSLDCEILFERVHWNAQVWLNGKRLGGSPDGYAPFRVLAGDAIRPGADNVLLVRVGGFAEVPKSKSGKPLFPAGFSMNGRGGGGGIMGRVFVRFFNKVRITRAQVMPDLATSTAKIWLRVEGTAPEAVVDLTVIEAGIGPDGSKVGGEAVAGKTSAHVKLANGVGKAAVPVTLKDVKPWTPATPFLYRLVATAQADGKPADRVSERFGMREIVSKPDGFYLNGRKIRLLGTNLIGDMGYWRGAPGLLARDKIKAGLIDGARATNAVCVRTHTSPFPKWWLDVCDEEGLLVLLEFPVTVNCANLGFDAKEQAEFGKNLENEAAAVIPYLANHPSIAMWVMTNESNNWHEWERTRLFEHFKRLDPSRPTIRASYDTPDGYDIHSYAAMWKGSCGDFEFRCSLAAEVARQKKTPPMITEYFGGMNEQVMRKWFGPAADDGDPKVRQRLAVQAAEFSAMRGMEQTEAARRLGYACILPFMGFYGIIPGRTPRPIDYAIPSALAPVGVSIDLANQHFVAGQTYRTDVWVMNDTDAKAATKIQFFLFGSDPGFDPAASTLAAVSQSAFEVQVDPHAAVTQAFEWKAPADEGQYFLLARIEPPGGKPVTSRRVIYAIRREPPPKGLAGRKVLVIEEADRKGDKKLSAWIGRLGCTLVDPAALGGQPGGSQPGPITTQPDIQLVVVAPGAASGAAPTFKTLAARLPGYVARGGHVVVLEQFGWPEKMKDLLGIAIERTDYDYDDENAPADQRADKTTPHVSQDQASGGSSRVFRWEAAQPERAIWNGIPDEYLWRWNGQHGRVARVSMSMLPGRAHVLVKYAEAERDDLKYVPVAAVGHVGGEVLYFMLQLAGRYDSADPDFDPIAERLMVNLLGY